jgi:hypothetical protein
MMTETPKTKLHINPDKINYSRGYKLNPEKLVGAPQIILPYFVGAFYYTEDFEYFDVIKPYLDIPEKSKTLEEISQELDEKFEKLIEKTHLEYRIGHNWLYKLRRYEEFCKKQDEDFESAKKYGSFPVTLTVGADGSYLVANNTVSWNTEYRIGKNEVGWWDIKPNIKVYLEKKPNRIVRYFSKLLLDFTWKDK